MRYYEVTSPENLSRRRTEKESTCILFRKSFAEKGLTGMKYYFCHNRLS